MICPEKVTSSTFLKPSVSKFCAHKPSSNSSMFSIVIQNVKFLEKSAILNLQYIIFLGQHDDNLHTLYLYHIILCTSYNTLMLYYRGDKLAPLPLLRPLVCGDFSPVLAESSIRFWEE